MKNSQYKSQVFTKGNLLVGKGLKRSAAFKHAYVVSALITAMKSKPVKVSYLKIDGTLRIARSTLQIDTINQYYQFKGSDTINPYLVTYFDLDKLQFRSFRIENLLTWK